MYNSTNGTFKKYCINLSSEIRKNATSLDDIITTLVDGLSKVGVNIEFLDYPCRYSDLISNSHSGPIDYKKYPQNFSRIPNKPSGYPGWSGTWKGTITVSEAADIDTKTLSLHELSYLFRFINTGTGCSGERFDISGKMFVFDFDKINENYEKHGTLDNYIINQYKKSLEQYNAEYSKNVSEYVNYNPGILKLNQTQRRIESILTKVRNKIADTCTEVENEFNRLYSVPIPRPPGPFISEEQIRTIYSKTTYKTSTPHPDLETTIKFIDEQVEKMDSIINQYPERFI